jgi:hypothetical protein
VAAFAPFAVVGHKGGCSGLEGSIVGGRWFHVVRICSGSAPREPGGHYGALPADAGDETVPEALGSDGSDAGAEAGAIGDGVAVVVGAVLGADSGVADLLQPASAAADTTTRASIGVFGMQCPFRFWRG